MKSPGHELFDRWCALNGGWQVPEWGGLSDGARLAWEEAAKAESVAVYLSRR